jgi:tRNA threonylcarbamoyladenosine dehydratase
MEEKNYEHPTGRTELLVGEDGIQRLAAAKVFVFGLGGVGGYAAEALARAGVGRLVLCDFDTVTPSNLNRQVLALRSTIDQPKVRLAAARIHDISPHVQVKIEERFAEPENIDEILGDEPAYIIDAIDSIYAKVALLAAAHQRGWLAVSCMGAGNRLSPTGIRIEDISETKDCPLARVVRKGLRKQGILEGIRCVYTRECNSIAHDYGMNADKRKHRVQGSISYVPGIVGLTAAGEVIQAILGEDT